MWIKICGITSLEDAECAVAAGADAIGFVFAESPRRVTPEVVRDIVNKLPYSVEKIGVFVDVTWDEIAAVHQFAGLTGVQLHGSGHNAGTQTLHARAAEIPRRLRVIQVVRYDGNSGRFALELRNLHENFMNESQQGAILPEDAVLIDSCIAGKQGGTGHTFDWLAARDSFFREAPHLRLIAAGGLNAENVREAIQTLHPWGVDVSSGVESTPGRKDPSRVAAFIRAARAADANLVKAARV